MNVYIACGLTHVPRDQFSDYVSLIHTLAGALTTQGGCSVRYALKDSDPQLAVKPVAERARLCYAWDREMVEQAEVVVAEASHPSTGLGIELQIACGKGIPIVLVFRTAPENRVSTAEYQNPDRKRHHLQVGDGYVSLMALGVPTVFTVVPYGDTAQCTQRVLEAVKVIGR